MDYRTGIRMMRALANGEETFLAAVEDAADYEPRTFATFARTQNLRQWLTPLAASDRARAALDPDLVEELDGFREGEPARSQALLDLCAPVLV